MISRLDLAGAVDLGTLNMAEFALGATGHNATMGDCRNAWDPQFISGGSSSGSAVAVASGAVFASLGSDTGGSVRIPASANGVIGLKPTYGLIPRTGSMKLSPSIDVIGPMARSARDIALLLEVLAGVPTVVYGFFAVTTVGPILRVWGESIGLDVAGESALAAGLVMGIMIIPFVSSLADDMITAVPQSLRDGAYALGATRSETIKQVVLRAALPGIVGGVLLAISRAIGETMIVVMAAGLSANLTANPLEAVTTVTVQIVTLLVGDQEFDSPKTLAAFALGLMLFIVTLVLNVIALYVVRKYREQYE